MTWFVLDQLGVFGDGSVYILVPIGIVFGLVAAAIEDWREQRKKETAASVS